MKKNFKMLVMSLVLAVSVLTSLVPAQAAQTRSEYSNNWEFELKKDQNNKVAYVGQTIGLILSNDISGNKVTWKSGNTKIATVDQLGNVKGKKAGKVTITATDGIHKAKCNVIVKSLSKAKKDELVFNYGDDVCYQLNKTYTLKCLNGGTIKKIKSTPSVKASGTKFTIKNGTIGDWNDIDISVKRNTKTYTSKGWTYEGNTCLTYYVMTNKEREEAVSIIKRDMKEYGITKNSTDLEKAMFVYNWLGDHVSANGAFTNHCTVRGSYCAIRKGYGDCDVYAEGVDLICEVVGLWSVAVNNKVGDHQFSGIRLDGKWYLVDTMQCESWEFALGNDPNFLSSYEHMTDHSGAMAFVSNSKLSDISFDNTEYDRASWPEYRDKFDAANADDPGLDPDFWND